MSARLQHIHEELENVRRSIASRLANKEPVDELIEIEKKLAQQLSHARELLTENTNKVLRG